MKNWLISLVSSAILASVVFTGCSSGVHEHYVSPHATVEGSASRINLEEVQKAFWDSKGKDFNGWMAAFEKRVNEIYDGKEVVSIDATRDNGKLIVTGYIDKDKKEGFHPGDEKLFSLEQTGDAVNNEMPYRMAGGDGGTYYQGHHSFLDNPILQAMLISHMMGGWGGRYYTPAPQMVVLQHGRDSFRASPQYQQQQTSNQSFFSRFKTNSAGDLQSRSKFGSGPSNSSTQSRSFGSTAATGSSTGSSTGSGTSTWGGRRSSFGSGFGSGSSSRSFGGGFSSRSWGGRRGR
jgi:hypothetical protein